MLSHEFIFHIHIVNICSHLWGLLVVKCRHVITPGSRNGKTLTSCLNITSAAIFLNCILLVLVHRFSYIAKNASIFWNIFSMSEVSIHFKMCFPTGGWKRGYSERAAVTVTDSSGFPMLRHISVETQHVFIRTKTKLLSASVSFLTPPNPPPPPP